MDWTTTPEGAHETVRVWVDMASGHTVDSTSYRDGLGRVYRSVSEGSSGRLIEKRTAYDQLGRGESEELPRFVGEAPLIREFAYDPLSRRVLVREPGGRDTIQSHYRGRVRTDGPEGERRDRVSNVFGEVVEVHEYPDGAQQPGIVTSYAYDHGGRLVSVTPPAAGAGEPFVGPTQITYDKLGRKLEIRDPDTGLSTFIYDGAGNPTEQVDARGRTTYSAYDALNRVTASGTQLDTGGLPVWDVELFYDDPAQGPNELGRLTGASDQIGQSRFRYDELGRPIEEVREREGLRFEFVRSYTPIGELETYRYPVDAALQPAAELVYEYDENGYLVGVRDVALDLSLVDGVEFDARGRLRSMLTSDGVTASEIYSPTTDLIEQIRIVRNAAVLEHLIYDLDDTGRVRGILDRARSDRDRTFQYDPLGRLIAATGPFAAGLTQTSLAYSYDGFGNLVEKDGVTRAYGAPEPRADGLPGDSRPHAVAAVGATPLTYDAAGNPLGFGARTFTWDDRGRLSGVSDGGQLQATYSYDFAGRRAGTEEGGETRWFINPDFEWDGEHVTVHIQAANRLVASLKRDFSPQVIASQRGAPPSSFALAVTALLAVVPPLSLLIFLLLTGASLQQPVGRTVEAVVCLVALWWGITLPGIAVATSDSDGDGLSDADEIQFYLTDPLSRDSDQDGHADGREVAAGSDPTSAASSPHILSLGATSAVSGAAEHPLTAAGTQDQCPLASPGCMDLPDRLGYEPARRAASADADSDTVPAGWDEDDSDPSNSRIRRVRDLDRDGFLDAWDADADGDGVANLADLDDDNDGRLDADELLDGTDPLDADSDSDGLLDGAEETLGTDPLLADTDADGISDLLDLAPTDPARGAAVGQTLGDLNGDGIVDVGDALLGMQITGGHLTPTPQQERQADVAPLASAGDGAITQADVLVLMRAVLSSADVDGDGLDGASERAAGSSPLTGDTDGDGVSDADEVLQGTSPTLRDSDGDGRLDADELWPPAGVPSTDPTNPDSDGDGIPDGEDGLPTISVLFNHADHLGSTATQTNQRGDPVSRVTYRPFGSSLEEIGKTPDFGFTGQRFEASVGLYDYGARFYDPVLGRFLSPDAIVPEPGDPQSLNRYSYVRNSPTNRVDPGGSQDAEAATVADVQVAEVPEGADAPDEASEGEANASVEGGGSTQTPDTDANPDETVSAITSDTVIEAAEGTSQGNANADPATNQQQWVNPTGGGIRSDAQGDGNFGSPRPYGPHRGADYEGTAGQDVVAPANGTVTRPVTAVYRDAPHMSGAVVVTPQGHEVKLFYVTLDGKLIGQSVTSGQTLGTLQDLGVRYPGITNHVHVEIRQGGVLINPQTLIPVPGR